MRVSLSSLDPTSPLAIRIRAALDRDTCRKPSQKPTRVAQPVDCVDEDELHRAVAELLQIKARTDVLWFHVPNGGKRGKSEAGRLKCMGTLAGVADFVLIRDGRTFGLELKTPTGRLSKAQHEFGKRLVAASGMFSVARSLEEAQATLSGWGLFDDLCRRSGISKIWPSDSREGH